MITLSRGAQAGALLHDQSFADAWQRLHDRCPWATVTQSREFVSIWHEVYEREYELLFVHDRRESGELAGLLPMAVEQASGRLVAAGGIYAEYQAWLAEPGSNDFIQAALARLRETCPRQRLQFVFVPPGTPLEWAEDAWRARCEVRAVKRPLMALGEPARLEESLRKKHNRSHLNHLQRHGPLQFTRIASGPDLAEVFDEINAFAMLRLSGFHGEPVAPDPLKKALFARLADAGLVHASVLRAGEAIVSAQVHFRNRNESLRGMSAFSPVFAQHSPSNLHTLMLGIELSREGVPVVDLTPGGEYKDRFATHEDTAYILTIFANARDRFRHRLRRRAATLARRGLGLDGGGRPRPWQQAILEAAKRSTPRGAMQHFWQSVRSAQPPEPRQYTVPGLVAQRLTSSPAVQADRMRDLLCREAGAGAEPASARHRIAIDRLQNGCHVFTEVEGDVLMRTYWLLPAASGSRARGIGPVLDLPEDAALVFDVRGPAPFGPGLSHVLRAAAAMPGVRQVVVAVPPGHAALEADVAALGGEPATRPEAPRAA
jgi:CelD/BcsL family acetyltransferase involved in cellulose biosynthesis